MNCVLQQLRKMSLRWVITLPYKVLGNGRYWISPSRTSQAIAELAGTLSSLPTQCLPWCSCGCRSNCYREVMKTHPLGKVISSWLDQLSGQAKDTQTGTRGIDLGRFKLSLRYSLGFLLHSIGKIPKKGVGRPNLLVYIQWSLLLSRRRVL